MNEVPICFLNFEGIDFHESRRIIDKPIEMSEFFYYAFEKVANFSDRAGEKQPEAELGSFSSKIPWQAPR